MDIKSINIAWLIEVGIDGKSGLPDPRQDGGVLSTRWHSPCWGSMGCRAVQYHRPDGVLGCPNPPGHQTGVLSRPLMSACVTGRHILLTRHLRPVNCRAVCWAVTGQVIPCWVVTGWAVNCWAFHHLWRPATAAGPATSTAGSSTWTGWAGEEITVIVLLSGDLATFWSQLYFTSGDVRWSGPFSTLSSSLMMMTGRRLSVGRCPRWRWLHRICNRLKTCNDGEHERKRPKDGCPSPWKRGWTLNYQSHPLCLLELDPPEELGWDRSTSLRLLSCLEYGVWGSPGVCRPRVFSSDPHSHNLWRSDPSEAGRPTTEMLEAMDFGSQDLEGRVADFSTSVALDPELVAVFVRFRPVAAGTLGRKLKNFFRSMDFDRIVHGLTFLGFLCRSRGLAPFLLFIGLGLCLPSLKQPIFTDIAWLVFCQPFAQSTLLAAKVVAVSSAKVPATWELQLGFSGRWRAMWSHIRHLVHTGMAWHEDENKLDFVPQATWPNV